jgi:nucleoside-diphosphate-sugar epimerase
MTCGIQVKLHGKFGNKMNLAEPTRETKKFTSAILGTGSAEVLDALDGAHLVITGASGFVGTALLEELNRRLPVGHLRRLTCIARKQPSLHFQEAIQDLNVQWFQLDIRHGMKGVPAAEFVIHAATTSSATAQAEDPLTLIKGIVDGSIAVVDWAKATNCHPRVLFTSSGAIYGFPVAAGAKFRETDPGNVESFSNSNAYAESKRLAETVFAVAATLGIVEPVIARLFSFIGPHIPCNGHFAVGNFLGNAVNGKPVVIEGTGRPRRSYLYESDMAAWILRALTVPTIPNFPLNVGSSQAVSIWEMGKLISEQAGVDLIVKGDLAADGLRLDYVPDTTATEKFLGVTTATSLSQSIKSSLLGLALSLPHNPR